MPLLAPRSIAFVGASARPNTPGHDMVRMIRARRLSRHGPRRQSRTTPRSKASRALPSLADLPAPPDLAVLSVKQRAARGDAMREAIAVGARPAVIFASGMLDDDRTPPLASGSPPWRAPRGMPICGANCMGFYNDLDGVWICGFPSPRAAAAAARSRSSRIPAACSARSRTTIRACASRSPISPGQELTATRRRLHRLRGRAAGGEGRSASSSRRRAIPTGFARRSKRPPQRGVPVVALKVGRTEAAAAAALTHTGAMAGSDLAYEALFDRYGVVRVETLDELAAHAAPLRDGPPCGAGRARLHPRFGRRARDDHRPRRTRRRRVRGDRRRRQGSDLPRSSTRASKPTIRSMPGEPATDFVGAVRSVLPRAARRRRRGARPVRAPTSATATI